MGKLLTLSGGHLLFGVLLALAPTSFQVMATAKTLDYAVLLSEGPDTPSGPNNTVVPWGSYHITITGYLPCQTEYDFPVGNPPKPPKRPDVCKAPPAAFTPPCGVLVPEMVTAARAAWTIANGGYETYNLRRTGLMDRLQGQDQRAEVYDDPGKHTGQVLKILANELCNRGFSNIKGPDYGNYAWHISLGTTDRKTAQKIFDKHAKVGSAPPLKLWLVPCYTDSKCANSQQGCPCGNYIPGTRNLKPKGEQWIQIKPF